MSLRSSYASVLQLLRTRKGLSQEDLARSVTQATVSSLELAKSSATVNTSFQLASALQIEPVTLLALVAAAYQECTAREALTAAIEEMERLGLADTPLPNEIQEVVPQRLLQARERWAAVQELKARGYTQSQAIKELQLPESTLRRLWNQER
ncbi:helix-turn-helix transcriptional regulator [Pseudomonas sp. WHRI 8519]|uniref:helix-turn-helix transcriptional regulator n=1 Tax=Pseudomonas sp. WHRI 8519 TaxID=3162567 RepID=UPI0032EE87B8